VRLELKEDALGEFDLADLDRLSRRDAKRRHHPSRQTHMAFRSTELHHTNKRTMAVLAGNLEYLRKME